MNVLASSLLVAYVAVIAVICVYGGHRYWMVWQCLRVRSRPAGSGDASRLDRLPPVTIQLPMYNERLVARRIIESACAIDYPRDLLQVQVLDDSSDGSAGETRAVCDELRQRGHLIEHIHRTNRQGFKAGALAAGETTATGELVAVFDADFVPPPDVLRRSIGAFADPTVGMVQTRWSHLNRDESLLTQVQALFLDGHFVIEQTARAGSGRWFNFNGTAGIWRRSCIEDAGGWQHDTLTEDTDLSYRAQLAGWTFRYLDDVTCPAELPPTVSAFLSQQHRWNKGLIQTAIKLMPRILRSTAPLKTKVEAWFHLTSPLVHLVILLLVLLIIPATIVAPPIDDMPPATAMLAGAVVLTLGALAASAFYIASQWVQGLSPWRTLPRLPVLMAYGVGLSVTNSRAVIEACLGHESPFVRTPKFNGATRSETDPVVGRSRGLPAGIIEVALGVAMLACCAVAVVRPHTLVGLPFLFLFAAGYLTIGVPSVRGWLAR